MDSEFDWLTRAADGRDGGVRLVPVESTWSNSWLERVVECLRRCGYVCVFAGAEPPDDLPRVLHRHVAIFCKPPADRAASILWVRRLAAVSPRRHLVLWPADARASWPRGFGPAGTLSWDDHLSAAIVRSDDMVRDGEVSRARAWICSLETEAVIRGIDLPPSVRERRACLDFWLGEDLPARATEPAAASAEELGWLGLAAWRDGRTSRLGDVLDSLKSRQMRRDPRAGYWLRVLEAISGQDRRSIATLTASSLDRIDARQLLLVAVRVWQMLRSGESRHVARWCDNVQGRGPEAVLLRAMAGRTRAVRCEWPGIRAFLAERITMVSVEGLGRLLKVMEQAPDERSSLNAGCAWLRRHGADVAVAIVTLDGARIVAGQGWKPADIRGPIAAILSAGRREPKGGDASGKVPGFYLSIRSGASAIAHLVVGAADDTQSGLLHAAQAFAMLAGSAVRACMDSLDARAHEREGLQEILGRSQAMVDVRTAILRAAATSFPVLIEGESGTGKELAARALHRLSARRERRFLAVNCAALTDDLVEAELFGHARGAFTGAIGPRAGLFEEANGGTLFLDEVSELSPRAQAKLLRVLQEREVRRVGESAPRSVDVRIIAATNVPLGEAVARGRFRSDLRFRLAVVGLRLPALRERLEDLPVLIHVFWRRVLAETGKRAYLGPDALAQLARHSWPGNVRELQNVVAGLAVAAPVSGRVTARHVGQVIAHVSGPGDDTMPAAVPLDAARRVFERRFVAATLARHAGRRSAAASELGLTRQGLAKTLRRLGLSEDEAGVA